MVIWYCLKNQVAWFTRWSNVDRDKDTTNRIKSRFQALLLPYHVARMGSSGKKHGEAQWQQDHRKAINAKRGACKNNKHTLGAKLITNLLLNSPNYICATLLLVIFFVFFFLHEADDRRVREERRGEGRGGEERRGEERRGEGRGVDYAAACYGALWFCAVCLLVCLSVSAPPCPLCSPALSRAVLSCAVDNMSTVRSFWLPQCFHVFSHLVAMSCTFTDVKPYLMCNRDVAWNL